MAIRQESLLGKQDGRDARSAIGFERSNLSVRQVIFEYGPPIVKTLATAAVLFEMSMGMGKLRQQPCNIKKGPSIFDIFIPFIRPNPGRHADVNNLARTDVSHGQIGRGRKWKRWIKSK